MKQYLALMEKVLNEGTPKNDRTGTGTLSIFGHQMRFNLQEGFPLVTTKRCHLRSIIHELLWFLNGDTNMASLKENNVSIWDEWADENGDLGPVYGKQWRSWGAADGRQIDQLAKVLDQLKNDPDSRRIIVSAWNVGELDQMALAPCHAFFQFYVADGKLSCQLYQRSCDVFLAVQHRQLRAAGAYDGAAVRSGAGRFRLDRRRHASLQQPSGAGAPAADPRAASAAEAGNQTQARLAV